MQLLRDNLVSIFSSPPPVLTTLLIHSQTLWTSSEAEPSGEAAAAPETAAAGETKDTSDAPAGEDAKHAQ